MMFRSIHDYHSSARHYTIIVILLITLLKFLLPCTTQLLNWAASRKELLFHNWCRIFKIFRKSSNLGVQASLCFYWKYQQPILILIERAWQCLHVRCDIHKTGCFTGVEAVLSIFVEIKKCRSVTTIKPNKKGCLIVSMRVKIPLPWGLICHTLLSFPSPTGLWSRNITAFIPRKRMVFQPCTPVNTVVA